MTDSVLLASEDDTDIPPENLLRVQVVMADGDQSQTTIYLIACTLHEGTVHADLSTLASFALAPETLVDSINLLAGRPLLLVAPTSGAES